MKNQLTHTFLFLVLICSSISDAKVFDKKELEAKIDALIPSGVNQSTPGLVIGIVQNGKLVFGKGYGLANMAYKMSNNPKMVYNIGSVSKQFLGYAFAMLHVNGDLNLDDPVAKYLEDWPKFKHKVTLRHLLSHTSGYREAYAMSALAGRNIGVDRLTRKECLDVVRNQPELEFIPGSRFTYNSTAWVILAEVMEKVTGQPADKWVETNILQPLKMNDTQIESYVGEVILNTAESYSYIKEKGYINQESNRAIFGAAEVYSSVNDMVKWINNYRTAEIGGRKVNNIFLKPFILNDGTDSEYALGIFNGSYRGLKRYRHTGGHEAFSTQLSYFPEQDLGIFTVSNFGRKGWLDTSKIADIILEEHMTDTPEKIIEPIEMKQDQLTQLSGVYIKNTYNRTIEFTMVDGSLFYGKSKLIPIARNAFHLEGSEIEIQVRNISNEKTQLTILDGAKKTYYKAEKWNPDVANLKVYNGDYWSEELETVYHLNVNDEKLTVQHRWLGELPLVAVAKDFFKTKWGVYIKFNRNKENQISSLSVNSGRTLNVKFHRK
jgi:CubicO group peptidase (beta-lactamase class C family)